VKVINSENFNTLPDAVLFDTDNTLYEYEPAHSKAISALKDKFKKTFSISDNQFERTYNAAREEIKEALNGSGASHSRLLYIQRMLEMLNLGSQVLMALDFEQTYWRTFLSNAELFDDVRETLEDFRNLKIPVAIVTDLTAQIQFRKMVYFGLENHFDYIVTSEESGSDKPGPLSFSLAIKKMNAKRKKVWMIGDSYKNDIIGAKKTINAVAIQKIHKGVKVGSEKKFIDAYFKNFKELRVLLKKIAEENYEKAN